MPESPQRFQCFPADALDFLVELSLNNDREWFQAAQERYESSIREPARAFVRAMAEPIGAVSRHLRASDRKVGGSLMRPQRDVRFARDKTPYKSNVGIQFRHRLGQDVHAPGLYFHFDPQEAFVGAGIWHPDAGTLARVRARILARPAEWVRARDEPGFRRHFRLAGDSLRRAPRGVAAGHPLVEDLRRKDFLGLCPIPLESVARPGLVKRAATRFAAAAPLLRFLCRALELPF